MPSATIPAAGMSGMQAAAGVAAIEVARKPVGEWSEEQIGTSAQHASDIMSRGGQGAIAGAYVGGPYGAIAGAVVGTAIGIIEEITGGDIFESVGDFFGSLF